MTFNEILEATIKHNASDAFIVPGGPLRARICSEVRTIGDYIFTVKDLEKFTAEVTDDLDKENLKDNRSCELSFDHNERWRFRIGIFYQREVLSITLRKIDLNLLTFEELSLPGDTLKKMCSLRRGLILLTGLTGSGKSTAIAAMIEHINQNFGRHIMTIEEPIEFTFKDKKSVINQREVNRDTRSYQKALKETAMHSPDVLYIGNIRDRETCYAALSAAETGVLVFSTIHTINAPSTIERMVNFFPPEQHDFVFNQLSFLLKGVVSVRLLSRSDKEGLIPAYEVMTLSQTISSLINEHKIREIPQYMASGQIYDMITFNQCLWDLIKKNHISPETAIQNSDEKENLKLMMKKESYTKE
ncbi:MAG: PilT/PilU family type 4a pilus ATPase [Candidatus Omnitrophota bacterium]